MNPVFKIAVLVLLGMIILSLVQGMRLLASDAGAKDKTRLVKMLTVRISLSFLLFLILGAAYYLGLAGR